MSIVTVVVEITGISPLLMHRFPLEPIESIEKKSPAEQAELSAYRTTERILYIPGLNVQRCLVSAATFSKGKGRSSLQKQVAACVIVSPQYCLLGSSTYLIDSQPIVVPATGGRVLRHRPRLDVWKTCFEIAFDNTLLKETELRHIVDDAGSRVGLLDFRPECKGPFGRFMVTSWK